MAQTISLFRSILKLYTSIVPLGGAKTSIKFRVTKYRFSELIFISERQLIILQQVSHKYVSHFSTSITSLVRNCGSTIATGDSQHTKPENNVRGNQRFSYIPSCPKHDCTRLSKTRLVVVLFPRGRQSQLFKIEKPFLFMKCTNTVKKRNPQDLPRSLWIYQQTPSEGSF